MDSLRVDKWLWFARFTKSRSLAQHVIEAGEVFLNGAIVGKPSATVKPGDELAFPFGRQTRRVRILALGTRRGPGPEARALYEDLPPLPVENPPLFHPAPDASGG